MLWDKFQLAKQAKGCGFVLPCSSPNDEQKDVQGQ